MKNPIASKKKRFDKVRARLYCIQKEKFDEVYESRYIWNLIASKKKNLIRFDKVIVYQNTKNDKIWIWLHPNRKNW